MKRPPGKSRKAFLTGGRLVLLNVLLLLIPIGYFGHEPFLRQAAYLLIRSDTPEKADAIVVLGGGDPSRALTAVDLYRTRMSGVVVITTESPPGIYERLKQDGIDLFLPYENYQRVLEGYGVPKEHILRIRNYADDTYDEMAAIRRFAEERGWKRLIIVTSNFHTRRTKLVARDVMAPGIHASVVSAGMYDSFDPESWWTTQAGVRTFVIEFEKMITYTLYIQPRLLWRAVRG